MGFLGESGGSARGARRGQGVGWGSTAGQTIHAAKGRAPPRGKALKAAEPAAAARNRRERERGGAEDPDRSNDEGLGLASPAGTLTQHRGFGDVDDHGNGRAPARTLRATADLASAPYRGAGARNPAAPSQGCGRLSGDIFNEN